MANIIPKADTRPDAGPKARPRPDRPVAGVQRLAAASLLGLLAGCGTTRLTDTQRTGTEQLLVSNAVDQAISQLDFSQLAGKSVFFDAQYLDGTVDRGYLVSSLRQQLLASGCTLQEERAKATYVVEARSGGLGTESAGAGAAHGPLWDRALHRDEYHYQRVFSRPLPGGGYGPHLQLRPYSERGCTLGHRGHGEPLGICRGILAERRRLPDRRFAGTRSP